MAMISREGDFVRLCAPSAFLLTSDKIYSLAAICAEHDISLSPNVSDDSIYITGSCNGQPVEIIFPSVRSILIGRFADDTDKAFLYRSAKELIALIPFFAEARREA